MNGKPNSVLNYSGSAVVVSSCYHYCCRDRCRIDCFVAALHAYISLEKRSFKWSFLAFASRKMRIRVNERFALASRLYLSLKSKNCCCALLSMYVYLKTPKNITVYKYLL